MRTILREPNSAAVFKRELAVQLHEIMSDESVSQAELARRMSTSRTVVRRLLDERDLSTTLLTFSKAADALGRQLCIELKA